MSKTKSQVTPHVMAETLRLARQDVATNEQGIMGMYARALVSLEEQLEAAQDALDLILHAVATPVVHEIARNALTGCRFDLRHGGGAETSTPNPASERMNLSDELGGF